MWELDCEEGWAPKNWCFWTVVLEKTLESPLDCKEIQPVHSKENSPGCSLEGMMLKLKLQYFGHLMRRVDSLEKTLMLGGIGSRRKRGQQRMTRWTWVWVNSRSWWWTGRPGVLQFMGSQRVGHDWTELTRRTLVGKVMSLLLNILSRLVITFLPRSKCLLISWLQSPSAVILEPKK